MSEYMSKYIDVNELKHSMAIKYITNGYFFVADAIQCIDEAPTADVNEVKHGRWDTVNSKVTQCSVCGVSRDIRTQVGWNFCPVCGAKMSQEES